MSENDKDILIITLLEYICQQQKISDNTYQNTINYLQSNGIIDKIDDYENIKNNFMDMIMEQLNLNSAIVPISNKSRYEDDFIELGKIGDGGFGTVYKTINKLDKVVYAIKKIPIKCLNIENNKVLNESILLANLSHNNIIRYYSTWIELDDNDDNDNDDNISYDDSFTKSNNKLIKYNDDSFSWDKDDSTALILHNPDTYISTIYIQMELCKMTLKDYILKINEYETYNVIKDIINGINYIHSKNIIHCDLSLKNILVDGNNTIKICDFGLAEYIGDGDHVIKSNMYGVLLYCGPEIIKYNKYSYKSDIYALGIIFYEILSKFKTEMERMRSIQKFKNKEIKCKYDNILYKMINDDGDLRPSIKDILFT
jgi:translation initiation factor 2-alpha kinase 4